MPRGKQRADASCLAEGSHSPLSESSSRSPGHGNLHGAWDLTLHYHKARVGNDGGSLHCGLLSCDAVHMDTVTMFLHGLETTKFPKERATRKFACKIMFTPFKVTLTDRPRVPREENFV